MKKLDSTIVQALRCIFALYLLSILNLHNGMRESSFQDFVESSSLATTQLYDEPGTTLPEWIIEYFAWHNAAMSQLDRNHSQWGSYKYLVVRCLTMDHKCGGAADRLKSIPLALLMASKYRRILFIEWEKPYSLSEFLLPVEIDWRIPSWLHTSNKGGMSHDKPTFVFQRSPSIVSVKHLSRLESKSNDTLLDMRFQSNDYGQSAFDRERHDGATFEQVYSILWSRLFHPSLPVQKKLDNARSILGISQRTPDYVSLHFRSLYFKDKSNDTPRIQNALRCVAPLSKTIFVASDSPVVSYMASRILAESNPEHRTVSTTKQDSSPLHLDRGSHYLSTNQTDWVGAFPAHAYYGIFVDLYLLSAGRCVAYNIGGFGHWASLISPHRRDACEHFNHQQRHC